MSEEAYEEAQTVLNDLPESGQFIVRHLFNLIPRSRGFSYYMNMITFGTDQKGDWSVNEEMIKQFENLLVNLDWSHAELIHTFTGTRIVWEREQLDNKEYSKRNDFNKVAYGSFHDLKETDI